jgi:hypothetical protein
MTLATVPTLAEIAAHPERIVSLSGPVAAALGAAFAALATSCATRGTEHPGAERGPAPGDRGPRGSRGAHRREAEHLAPPRQASALCRAPR